MFSMEEMLSKKNQREALSFLKNKKDGMGADGMPLSELEDYWKINSERICSELKKGKYTPGIIKCTEIINNRGKRRVISNLCTVDRFITRLLYQKLRRYISPEFLENSYAYQENKGILNAVQKVQEYISEGSKYTMEIDLKDYFDTIPHEQTMSLIKERITDDRVVDLIYKYMHCSVSQDNEIKEKKKGLVQGNAISTVLSNLYLHSLDQYLQEKEYKWVRFADNINVYCRKENDAIRVYNEINIYIKEKLHLTINEKKSGIYSVLDRIFLGYKFYKYNGKYEAKKYKYQKTDCFHNWHESALQRVNHEYHIVQNGVLNKKDYSLIFENEEEKCDIPVGVVDQINIYSEVTIAATALQLISKKKIRLSIIDKYGNLIGNYIPAGYGRSSIEFLKQAVFYESSHRFEIAQKIEVASIHNLRANVKYYSRKNAHALDAVVEQLSEYMNEMRNAQNIEELMIIEAQARQQYYASFNIILKQESFFFEKRTRRPPKDAINALISFGNTLLYNFVLQAIWKTSLDPRIGIIHATTNRNYSLNLDFADLFKPVIVDRVIFSLVNLLQLQSEVHFEEKESGAIYLNKEGKRIFIKAFEEKLADKIKVGEKMYTYKQIIEEEIRKFQRYIVKEEKYKPYKYW